MRTELPYDFPVVTASDGQPRFMVWSRALDRFEAYNGNQSWRSWPLLRADLLAEQGREDGERLLQQYQALAPQSVQRMGLEPAPGEPVRPRRSRLLVPGLALLAVMLALACWPLYIRPALEETGLLRPRSAAELRYQRFLQQTEGCTEKKNVPGDAASPYPREQVFLCPDGNVRFWKQAPLSPDGVLP
ncbi:hypothetical protein D0B54_06475 [Solimonas sp. K1W22B-7]|uniref:hypothetical protein n=1 Tax=Solimonas sp. K1W22B-7 TaxID=2303331 RepID=UPI000E3335A6|nr:hypothetical protein [Solimonas sp. K1W22B-7]AXQ28347.1 hypothetical protein D0B54_06475 [Solimonas sp. K1W22B-7]